MQCPRCYFDNPAGTRHCAYCGGEVALGAAPRAPAPGAAAQKRKTQLGPPPGPEAWDGTPPPTTPLEQEDPFELAATGIRGGAAASPREPVGVSMGQPPRKATSQHRATLVDDPVPELDSEVVGCLMILPEDGRPSAILLRYGSTRVGRSRSSHLCLDDPRVSGDHAVIQAEKEQAWLLDTSSNGSIVSGERVRMDRAPLRDGTIMQFGRTVVVVKLLSDDTLAVLRGAER